MIVDDLLVDDGVRGISRQEVPHSIVDWTYRGMNDEIINIENGAKSARYRAAAASLMAKSARRAEHGEDVGRHGRTVRRGPHVVQRRVSLVAWRVGPPVAWCV